MTENTGGGQFARQPGPPAGQDSAPFTPAAYAGPRPEDAGRGPARGYGQPGSTPEQLAYHLGQQGPAGRQATPRMTGWRVACGMCWGLWTVLFGIGAIVSLAHGAIGSFLLAAVVAGLAGWYDYRIWTLKARRLTMFIIF